MKAQWLDSGQPITPDELNSEAVPYAAISPDEATYPAALADWKRSRGYQAEDEVHLSPDTPGLDKLLAQFSDEHYHTDDEVRYIVAGTGVFDIRSRDDHWMRIEVTAGDFIIVPAHTYHRFTLTEERRIHAVRLFKENPAWEPIYRK